MKKWNGKKWTIFGTVIGVISLILAILGLFFIEDSSFKNNEINGDNNIVGNQNKIVNNYYSECSYDEKTCKNNTELLILDINSLEGNCNHIYAKNNDLINFNQGSVAFWTTLNRLNLSHDRYLIDLVNMNNESFVSFWISDNKVVKFKIKDSYSQEFLLSYNFKKNISEWVFVVGTWGNGEMNLYINGERDSSLDLENINFKEIVSGWYFGSSHLRRNCLNGKMDEVSLWRDPLPQEEIKKIYYYNNLGCRYPIEDCSNFAPKY